MPVAAPTIEPVAPDSEQEPAAIEPVAPDREPEPAATDPAAPATASERAATEPEAPEPVATEPEAPEPVATEPHAPDTRPDLAGPEPRPQSRPVRLHRFAIHALAELAAKLDAEGPPDSDMVLALPAGPAGAAAVLVEPEEVLQVAQLNTGICVAASPAALASPAVAERIEQAVAETVGSPVLRCHPFPYALLGPCGQLRSLLANLPDGDTDADRLTEAALSNRHDIAVDMESVLFHVLDGTGTDVAFVDGRAVVAGEQPLVLIDPSPGCAGLVRAQAQLMDGGARDLGRLLRYNGAVADATLPEAELVSVAAVDVLVTPLWTPEFCATVVRAAEAAGVWEHDSGAEVPWELRIQLADLSPRLFALLEDDLNIRVWPRLWGERPPAGVGVGDAAVVRCQGGDGVGSQLASPAGAQLVGSVRLNDGYRGGALTLPLQSWDDSQVPVGALTVWPSDSGHPKQTEPVTSGVKYTLSLELRSAAM